MAVLPAPLVAGAVEAHPHTYFDQQVRSPSLGPHGAEVSIVIVPSTAIEGKAIHAHLDLNGDDLVSQTQAALFQRRCPPRRAKLTADGKHVGLGDAADHGAECGRRLLAGSGAISLQARGRFDLFQAG